MADNETVTISKEEYERKADAEAVRKKNQNEISRD